MTYSRRLHPGYTWECHSGSTCGQRTLGIFRRACPPEPRCLRRTCSQSAQVDPVRRPKRWRRGPALSRDPRRFPYATTPLSAAHRLVLYQLASKCRRARCPPATAVFPGPCGGLICSCFGCRHPELPTWSWDLPVVSWGVVFSVGGATLVSLVLGNHLPIHLVTVINYKILGKVWLLLPHLFLPFPTSK